MTVFRRAHIPWIAAALGTLATLAAYRSAARAQEAAIRAEFTHRSQVIASIIATSVRLHEDTLRSLRNLFQHSDSVSRTEFAGAAADLLAGHEGIHALEWIQRVPGPERRTLEATVQAEGFPGFEFRQRIKGNTFERSADRPEHYPVLYIEPYAGNEAALGFDLASSSIFGDFLQSARDDFALTSSRVRLITDGRNQDWGYLLLQPVYSRPLPTTAAERLARLRGFVLGIFRIDEIVEGSINRLGPQGIDLLVVDPKAVPENRVLHYHPSRMRKTPDAAPVDPGFPPSAYTRVITLTLPGRTWELHSRAAPEFIDAQRSRQPVIILAIGLFATGLLGVYLRANVRRTSLVEQEVAARTEELRRTQELLEDDIRQRKAAEQALKASETRLQAILDHNPNSIFVKDLAGRYVLVNRQHAHLWNRPAAEFIGRTDLELFPPDIAARFREVDQRVITNNAPNRQEVTVALPGTGNLTTAIVQKFPLRDGEGRVYGVCGISTDITALKQTEQEKITIERKLLAAQKLESLGVLAGGIAHDFNNILTSVLGNASLARHDAASGQPVDRSLQQIENAARRAADLCQQMLAYAGKGKIVTDRVNLSELVRDTAALLEVTVSKSTRLDLRLAEPLPPVLADPTQLRQIVMNLVINAADAILGPSGQITVTTFSRQADAAFLNSALGNPDLPPGTYVGLEVQDNGSGMSPETIARIFEPFFTTKFSGRGLGLSAVLGIVQSHRGALFVESSPGRGSTFRLLLPATSGPSVPSASPFPAAAARTVLRGTVLIVDDEEAVRSVAGTVLQVHGAAIMAADSGEDALVQLRAFGPRPALILLDVTMPGIGGEETLRRLRQLNVQQPVILMSGYSETETMQRCADLGVVRFIQKPFEVETLLAAVKPFLT